MGEPISKHFLRRTARRKARWLSGGDPKHDYVVRHYHRRLYKWAVYRLAKVER